MAHKSTMKDIDEPDTMERAFGVRARHVYDDLDDSQGAFIQSFYTYDVQGDNGQTRDANMKMKRLQSTRVRMAEPSSSDNNAASSLNEASSQAAGGDAHEFGMMRRLNRVGTRASKRASSRASKRQGTKMHVYYLGYRDAAIDDVIPLCTVDGLLYSLPDAILGAHTTEKFNNPCVAARSILREIIAPPLAEIAQAKINKVSLQQDLYRQHNTVLEPFASFTHWVLVSGEAKNTTTIYSFRIHFSGNTEFYPFPHFKIGSPKVMMQIHVDDVDKWIKANVYYKNPT